MPVSVGITAAWRENPRLCDTEAVTASYDALLVVSFGGPEGPDDVMPSSRTFPRRDVRPSACEVAAHYQLSGVKPDQRAEPRVDRGARAEPARPGRAAVYWGNRNWHPLLADTLRHARRRRGGRSGS